jgi:hypothetical protein
MDREAKREQLFSARISLMRGWHFPLCFGQQRYSRLGAMDDERRYTRYHERDTAFTRHQKRYI